MGLFIEVMHLLVVAVGIALAGWALVALRTRRPRGRFIVFAVGSAGAVVGCAALGGELGVVPPLAWLAAVVMAMTAVTVAALGTDSPETGTV